MAITLHLPVDVEQKLRQRAAQAGMTVEAFVVEIIHRELEREERYERYYARPPKSVECDVVEEAVPVLVEVPVARPNKHI